MEVSGYCLAYSCPKGDSIVLFEQKNPIGSFKVQDVSIVTRNLLSLASRKISYYLYQFCIHKSLYSFNRKSLMRISSPKERIPKVLNVCVALLKLFIIFEAQVSNQ